MQDNGCLPLELATARVRKALLYAPGRTGRGLLGSVRVVPFDAHAVLLLAPSPVVGHCAHELQFTAFVCAAGFACIPSHSPA